ncbi:MAG: aminodeoxychorismate/anthranilate synthase component II [Clostridium baratii]|uniref:Glutamine amidotransferase of anthranilate synthase/aminodeoxychorismate synthase family protein n=1 Tax=Clostridium baratii str. Sullivan TaxID=1415775 RepID=A0A0A7FW15_9CLOT|nr:aminodeoxychorismate/anthranilate synthase component II [Clostridium baratii]AIY83051.1 glutamine amidotransferase of anthranilate synthase/aminodeoxychorismate synthase family protein [Clostridium baratii str. Sullivan]MBS6005706.1 aminodeoxychorismate/anthranilate synthase component II [Clostridium baratii]CUP25841.1 anthranilate synthase component II [Clostridium baratii]
MILMIDNYDSFTYNLVRYFEELNEKVIVYRNDKINNKIINELKPSGIVISPGPKAPKDAKEVLEIIDSFKGKVPILGICLGHQCIGEYFKGNIVKGSKPVHGKISKITNSGEGIFKGLPKEFNVTRYHSLIIDKDTFPKELKITAETDDGVIMGIEHRDMKIYGVQYHPEAVLTEEGHSLLNNFIKICKEL